MAITALDILNSVAYRRGESGNPDNTSESAKRLRFLNEAYRRLNQAGLFWFHEKTASLKTEDGQELVTLPSDFRDSIEIRVDGIVRYPMPSDQAFDYYQYPPLAYAYKYDYDNKYYYIFSNELHLLPYPDSSPSALTVTTLAGSGYTATCTTSTNHGLSNNEFVVISGSDQSEFNGTFKIRRISETQFSYTMLSSATVATATGTITATKNNIIIRYYFYPTALMSTTDTVVIPDQYTEALVAYVWARLAHLDGERGTAEDGFNEFNEIIGEIKKENMRRNVWGKSVGPADSHYTTR
jgi:hypothetical protein